MKTSRSGMMLVELLAVLAMMTVFIILFSPMIPRVLKEMPAARQAAETQRQIAGVLEKIQQDMDRCVDLPAVAGDRRAGDRTLLIQTPADMIAYEWRDGNLARWALRGAAPAQIWEMPDAVIRWQALTGPAAKGVALRTAVMMQIGPRRVERLAGARVYYIDGLGLGAPQAPPAAATSANAESQP
jgi:hypothetical protein